MKIGIDIGGTKVAIGLVDNGKILNDKLYLLSEKEKDSKKYFLKRLFKEVKEIASKNKVQGIGVASPGPLDSAKGVILETPNIKSIRNLNIVRILSKRFKTKSALEHDASAAALAEKNYFSKKDIVYLSLGTGVGVGIIIGGKIYKGLGNASEGGHMTINFQGSESNCNNPGCFEEYVSLRGVMRIAKKLGFKDIDVRKIKEFADMGDKKAQDIFKEMGFYLGIGIVNFINILQPELIVIGGGISKAAGYFLPEAISVVKKRSLIYKPELKIVESKLGYGAGILGAAQLLG